MWMLGLSLREHMECRRCGGSLAETTDYAWTWKAAPPTVCFRCVALAASEKQYRDHPQHAGLIHHVAKRPRPGREG